MRRAAVDLLTGLPARGAFGPAWERARAATARTGAAVSLAFVDVDGLDLLNARHGWEAGDAVIQSAAATLTRSLYGTDHLFAWGGGAFAVLMPGVAEVTAARALDEAREQFRERRFRNRCGSLFSATVSAGVGGCDARDTEATLLPWIRRLLALAKLGGADRVLRGHALNVSRGLPRDFRAPRSVRLPAAAHLPP